MRNLMLICFLTLAVTACSSNKSENGCHANATLIADSTSAEKYQNGEQSNVLFVPKSNSQASIETLTNNMVLDSSESMAMPMGDSNLDDEDSEIDFNKNEMRIGKYNLSFSSNEAKAGTYTINSDQLKAYAAHMLALAAPSTQELKVCEVSEASVNFSVNETESKIHEEDHMSVRIQLSPTFLNYVKSNGN
jgi:hypothetical protein